MTTVRRARLTGRASAFVHMLQDFGHLDEEGAVRLLVALSEGGDGSSEALVDLEEVRRIAAAALFGDRIVDDEGSLLREDWPLLFS